jgi:hypothetical protein
MFFDETVGLRDNAWFLETMGGRGASAVKMAKGNGAAGDVCVWARRREDDPSSAMPTLSLRRQGGGATARPEDIRVRVRQGGKTAEKTLAGRLSELGLFHKDTDRAVEVSRQVAILPAPGGAATAPRPRPDHAILYPHEAGAATKGPGEAGAASGAADRTPDAAQGPREAGAAPPSVAFTFSVNVDGAAAYVITDGPSGGGEAVVAGDWHTMLFADAGGKRAPFAARAAAGAPGRTTTHQGPPDADVQRFCQRFCIVQVPLAPGAKGLAPGGFGAAPDAGPDTTWPAMATAKDRPAKAPPAPRSLPAPPGAHPRTHGPDRADLAAPRALPAPTDVYRPNAREQENTFVLPKAPPRTADMSRAHEAAVVRGAGFERLSIWLGAPEGPYSPGGGFRGNRDATRPVRVTYVYLVAPGGSLGEADARNLAEMIERLEGGD